MDLALQFLSHSTDSSLREKAVEHLFLGTLMGRLWCRKVNDLEILKPEVDRRGYDVVLESNGFVRHIQLKARFRGSTTASVDVHVGLLSKPGGCVIWVEFDPETMTLERYYWFGAEAGQPLPDLGERVARHSKGDALGRKNERPSLRVVSKGRFKILGNMDDVIDALFGERRA
jgi:hypothetical protein